MTEVEKCELKFDMDLVFAALPETHRRAALLAEFTSHIIDVEF